MTPLQLAVYGAGELAEPYLNLLARRADIRVRAVCDPMPRLAAQAAAGWGARVFSHYAPMLTEERPDALIVAVPSRSLGDVLDLAVTQSIPFLVEPPGAADWDSARRLARTISDAKLVTAVGYSSRYVDVVREAKEYLGVNATPLGRAAWLTGGHDDAPGVLDLLWNEACRLIDLWRCLAGEIMAVAANRVADDALVVNVRGVSGTIGAVALAAQAMAEPRIELELFGAGWSFSFTHSLTQLSLFERDKTTILRQVNEPRAEHLDAFLEAVRTQAPAHVSSPYPEALANLAVVEAIRRADTAQRWVELAEVTEVPGPAAAPAVVPPAAAPPTAAEATPG